jgi:Domain of Unknown Function (DUF1080)
VTDGTFSDFEIELEARPDWKTDTGVYVRINAQGNVGFQVCIDYRPHGAIGSYYGNGIGGFHACDYCFTGKVDKDGRLVELVPEKPSEPLDATHHVPLDYSVSAAQFVRNWNYRGWNHFRIRSVGAVPTLTTWINGLKVSQLDTAKMKSPDWDPAKVDNLVGRAGHIALEVHGNPRLIGSERIAGSRVMYADGGTSTSGSYDVATGSTRSGLTLWNVSNATPPPRSAQSCLH